MLGRRHHCPLTSSTYRSISGLCLCVCILATLVSCHRPPQRNQVHKGLRPSGKNPARRQTFRTFNVSSLQITYQVHDDHSGGLHGAEYSRRYNIHFGDELDSQQKVRYVGELLGDISDDDNTGPTDVYDVETIESGELIRLRSSRNFINSGLVQVYRAGKWGYVCDHSWNLEDATVACRQLGFTNGAMAVAGSNESLPPDKAGAAEVLMDNIRCSGNEQALQECQYSTKDNCVPTNVASVTCADNVGCPTGWQSGFGKCYSFFTNAKNIQQATNHCAKNNASLVNIESKEENHFLSNILKNSMPGIHQWHTGGRKIGQVWQWTKQVVNKPTSRKRNPTTKSPRSLLKTVRSKITQHQWFPGWPTHNNLNSEPTVQKSHDCLTLSDQFKNPARGTQTLDYFFWKADLCRKPSINFICQYVIDAEATSKVKECYIGKGLSYRGFASVTEMGNRCLSWSGSSKLNDRTHPRKGLGYHNYCRNPDNDARPWCWVNHERQEFGFCKLPKCSDIEETTTTVPYINVGSTFLNCPKDEFYCEKQKICIPEDLRCNKINDCTYGEDEQGCEYTVAEFNLFEGHKLILRNTLKIFSFASYVNINEEKCAKNCAASTLHICRSFVYNILWKSCELSEYNSQNGSIIRSRFHNYYELTSQLSCDGKFMCDNGYCVDQKSKCDGKDDCMDHSDERNCGTEEPDISVALVGKEEHAGTVEVTFMGVKGVICDDDWSLEDATVVCRMLGYKAAEQATKVNHFNYPVEDSVFLLDDVNCHGNETSLNQCAKAPWKTHDCYSYEIAGVVCQADKGCPPEKFKCKNKSCVKAEVLCDQKNDCADNSDELDCNSVTYRLVNGSSRGQGRVEIIRNGLKGTVCDDSWNEENAAVICKKMGFRYGGQVMIKSYFGEGTGPIWLDNVKCNGKEDSLDKCAHDGWGKSDCDHSEDVGVKCYLSPHKILPTITTQIMTETTWSTRPRASSTTSPPIQRSSAPPSAPFIISLTGGSAANEGDVIVTFEGVQYRICDDSWDNLDANVICKMLNYSDGGVASVESFFESSTSLDFLLDNVECKGTESHISNCLGIVGTNKHDCLPREAAGVHCKVKLPATSPPDVSKKPIAGGQEGVCGYKPYDHKELNRLRRSPLIISPDYDDLTAPRVTSAPNNLKIIGGRFVAHGAHPWQARFERVFSKTFNDHHCGGSIINEYWIISAAHCFTNKRKSELNIYVGDHSFSNEDTGEQKFEIDQLIVHEKYNPEAEVKDYDIALIKIKPKFGKGIEYNDYVQPVCLPDENTPYTEGTKCLISGWGNINPVINKGQYPSALKGAEIPLISQTKCASAYKKSPRSSFTNRMICAGYMAGGIDTCDGDSGGPLACKINDAYTLLGITSWGYGCAQPNLPGVYVNVRAFLGWIHHTIDTVSQSSQEKFIPKKP